MYFCVCQINSFPNAGLIMWFYVAVNQLLGRHLKNEEKKILLTEADVTDYDYTFGSRLVNRPPS